MIGIAGRYRVAVRRHDALLNSATGEVGRIVAPVQIGVNVGFHDAGRRIGREQNIQGYGIVGNFINENMSYAVVRVDAINAEGGLPNRDGKVFARSRAKIKYAAAGAVSSSPS